MAELLPQKLHGCAYCHHQLQDLHNNTEESYKGYSTCVASSEKNDNIREVDVNHLAVLITILMAAVATVFPCFLSIAVLVMSAVTTVWGFLCAKW